MGSLGSRAGQSRLALSAVVAGALYAMNATLTLDQMVFSDNEANSSGGALSTDDGNGTWKAVGDTLSVNFNDDVTHSAGWGG